MIENRGDRFMIRCDKKRVGIPADILDLGSRSLFSILSYIGHPLWRSFIGPFSHSNHCSILPFGLSKNSRIAIRLFSFSAQHLIIKLQQQKQEAIDFQWLLFLYTQFCPMSEFHPIPLTAFHGGLFRLLYSTRHTHIKIRQTNLRTRCPLFG